MSGPGPKKRQPLRAARLVARLISEMAQASPEQKRGLAVSFNGQDNLKVAIRDIIATDIKSGALKTEDSFYLAHQQGGADVARIFSKIALDHWRPECRPSLPRLADAIYQDLGVDLAAAGSHASSRSSSSSSSGTLSQEEQAVAKAALLVSARAELIRGQPPGQQTPNPYHNSLHTAYVAEIAGFLATKHNGLAAKDKGAGAALSRKDRMLVVLAAFAHDIDHQGQGNPQGDIYHNEDKSFAVVKPLLDAAGVAAEDQARLQLMIRTTSPDGPHAYLKNVAKARRNGGMAGLLGDNDVREGGREHPELSGLTSDPVLLQMAGMLSDADLWASSGAGERAYQEMTKRLSREMGADLGKESARRFFANEIVGADGYVSDSARALLNPGYYKTHRSYLNPPGFTPPPNQP